VAAKAARTWQRRPGGLLAPLLICLTLLLTACGGGGSNGGALSRTSGSGSPSSTGAAPQPTSTVVAQASVPKVPVYDTATAAAPSRTLPNPQPSGSPLVFVVEGTQGGRLEVLLPVRPNGTKGFISRGDVTLSQHDYRIVVALGAHLITVSKGTAVIDEEPIGVGTRDTPTPGGVYYTKELYRLPNANGPYGPFAYALSGYSDVLTDFAGGDGVLGIHGTNDPSAIGHDVSHGCIRMSNAGITKLAQTLPLGVPVAITA
jgi:lipoprotein-anchoring transpeptidase ErfK/SrfK